MSPLGQAAFSARNFPPPPGSRPGLCQAHNMELIDPEAKYRVVKLDDESVVEDAVVIRLKDPFAPTALFTYANTILNGIENWGDFWTEEERLRMVDLADYFHNKAMDSQKISDKRLPD